MKIRNYLLLVVVLSIALSCKKELTSEMTKLEGHAFGTTFSINYQDTNDYTEQIDSLFYLINGSLSTYIPSSDISKINNGDTTIIVDAFFKEVFEKSERIYKETNGVFDPTIGVLVNAWGFGPKKIKSKPDSIKIKQLLTITGFDKVHLINDKIVKEHDSTYFDFNAIAKGYAVDIAGRFLESKNIANYLVEIGGEIRTRGKKLDGTKWRVGIENPNFDGSRSVQKAIELTNEAMATSGNYRKFKIDTVTGKKYAHILNAKTGFSLQSNLLSVSVIGKTDCANVDGYATALMAMSLVEAKKFLANHQELRAYIIYTNDEGNLENYTTPNF